MKKNKIVKGVIIFGLLVLLIVFCLYIFNKNQNSVGKETNTEEKIIIEDYYSDYVVTNKESDIFQLNENDEFVEIGKVGLGSELQLKGIRKNYFLIDNLEGDYYIYYQDVDKIDNLTEKIDRYKKYIVFNENILTNEKTTFYDEDDNLVYEFNESFSLPIIIKKDEKYGVEFDNQLLYVKRDDVSGVIENHNTDLSNAKGIPVLNYHFAYKDGDTSCNEIICHSEAQMNEHFSYIKDNKFFTPTLKELEMYIDGQIRLPKSVVITFDDGSRAEVAREFVDKYELNAALFLITSWFSKDQFESEYLEIASHGDNLHNPGVCSGGQGGAIKCLEHDKLLADLKTSRDKLNGTTYFCYPFYEYNDYAISTLKEAGFTMAFVGESSYSDNLVKVGSDKFRLPRFVVVDYTTMKNFTDYINVE